MAQNVDVFENALTKATDFKEIRVITSDNKSQSITKEKFVELIDALVVARLKTLNIENNPTGIVVQNGTRFGSMTPQNLASVLGAVGMAPRLGGLYHAGSDVSKTVIPKRSILNNGNTACHAILICTVNDPTGQPSIFSFSRNSFGTTVLQGSVASSWVSVNNDGDIEITHAGFHLWWRIFCME